MPHDAVIVGAGPVGLTMAAALTRRGLSCRLVDKAPVASDKSKALVVWSRTLELLDGLDLAATFVETGMRVRGASIYGNGERLVQVAIAGVDSPFSFPLMIPQNETERLLTEHLRKQDIQIERQVELVSFRDTGDAVDITLRHADGREEQCTAPWLIGCDGAHSTVRHVLEMPFTGQAEPNDWLLADIHVKGSLARDELSIFWHEKGTLAFFPITADRMRVIADLGTAAGTAHPADPTLAEVQAKIDERGPGGLTACDPIWLAGFRINERKVSDYRRGRVFLAGDAAHIHSPAGGQGMNTGMQDAFNLAWKLALVHRGKGKAEPLFDSYSSERSAVGDEVLRGAGIMTRVATMHNPIGQFLRNHAASVLGSFGFVQDKIKNALCELSINYRHGPLSVDDWPALAGGLAAGDRLCDAPLACPTTGRQTTLFTAIHGDRPALLLLPGSADREVVENAGKIAAETERAFPNAASTHLILKPGDKGPSVPSAAGAAIQTWQDVEDQLHHTLAATGPTLILVRPDGYIGFRCQPASSEALLKYLDRFLVRGV